jgi:hypothetical protein
MGGAFISAMVMALARSGNGARGVDSMMNKQPAIVAELVLTYIVSGAYVLPA